MRSVFIQVDGDVSDQLTARFPGLTLQLRLQTTITGLVTDQAELQGVLNYLTDLGHDVVQVVAPPE